MRNYTTRRGTKVRPFPPPFRYTTYRVRQWRQSRNRRWGKDVNEMTTKFDTSGCGFSIVLEEGT